MNQKELKLDSRTQEDLCRRVEELAASYTPEWRFDRRDPDIGSALALIFTGQMAENIRRMNRLPEKYHTEFVNLLGLNLKPSYPASGVVVVDLLRGTVPGIALPRGSRLKADSANGSAILFETVGDVYITNARVTDVLSISGTKGRIHVMAGGLKPAQFVPASIEEQPVEAEEASGPQFGLFDYEETGIERNAMLLYHRNVFGAQAGLPVRIYLAAPEGKSLAKELTDPELWRWSYYTGSGLEPFSGVEVQDECIVLRRNGNSAPITIDGSPYHMICLEALAPISKSVTVQDIRLASEKKPTPPQLILHNGEELEAQLCMPLGETASVFEECYICDDQIFAQKDATVTLGFELSNQKKLVKLTAQQEIEELKIIKRKSRAVQYEIAFSAPNRIVLEYFNGQLWRRLPCSNDWASLFDGTHGGEYQISFRCPEDWASVPVNGYEGRCLRIRITQADNCYLMPCEHTMPVLRNVYLSYSYDSVWKQPQKLCTICGTQITEQTRQLLNGEPVTVFQPLPYPEASLYLGFDRPLEGAPISILFDVEESIHFNMEPVQFEYSTRTGFKQMKVVDTTENFSNAGTILFMPPSDFAAVDVEGISRWWLRIRGSEKACEGYHPKIRGIQLNAVDVQNKQTHPEEAFYVEIATPNMEYPLAARNILSAQVFVSELDQLSKHQMRKMIEEHPEDVRVEHDFLGEITAFYVRWTEVDSFEHSQSTDRHYMIDRARNVLMFGDGIHVRIPQARRGEAILVQTVSSDGAAGNVPAGAINGFYNNVLYVESVHNPVATYAGNDQEDLDRARRRGADILCGHGRLISEMDFVRAVKEFSGTIEKVKCVAGRDLNGVPDPDLVTIAIMTKDYASGAHSFHDIRRPLRKMLLERCDATMKQESLVISEPVYIEISVAVWVDVDDAARAFDVQNLILDSVRRFLEPLPQPGHRGWDIGSLPTENQIKMLLQGLRFPGHIGRMIVVGRYVDKNGVHEVSLDQLPDTPFAIAVNGDHKVYIEFR